MTSPDFDEAAWIVRLGVALEQVAVEARPHYSPPVADLPASGPIDDYWGVLRSRYRALAERARHDAEAASQFEKSFLWVTAEPAEAMSIVREHPLLMPGLEDSGHRVAVGFRVLGGGFDAELKWLVSNLAKLSVKEGGEEAAQRLHRYLTAGANRAVPAYEVSVVHGLVVKTRLNLGAGAYIEPYSDARAELDLPEEPEPWPKTPYPDAAVFVRSLEYGPGVCDPGWVWHLDDGGGPPDMQVAYRFPAGYQVGLERWFDDSKLLVDLLSIATRAPLLSRTRHVRLPKWITEIDPNFAFGVRHSGGFTSDVWPQGRELSQGDVDAFLKLARGYYSRPDQPDALTHAIRRLAASLSRPGGRFGQEDRILDTAIALEILYGRKTGHKLARRAAWLLGATAEQQIRIYDQARSFYRTRSRIMHMKQAPLPLEVLDAQLEAGRDLARMSLMRLLDRSEPPEWAAVKQELLAETEAHIEAVRSQ